MRFPPFFDCEGFGFLFFFLDKASFCSSGVILEEESFWVAVLPRDSWGGGFFEIFGRRSNSSRAADLEEKDARGLRGGFECMVFGCTCVSRFNPLQRVLSPHLPQVRTSRLRSSGPIAGSSRSKQRVLPSAVLLPLSLKRRPLFLDFIASARAAFFRLRNSRRRSVFLDEIEDTLLGRFTRRVVPFHPGWSWCPQAWHPWAITAVLLLLLEGADEVGEETSFSQS